MIKKLALLVFFTAGAVTLQAQSAKCEQNFEAFKEQASGGVYDDALVQLTALRKECPKFNDTIYIYGEDVLRYKAEASRTPEEKRGYIDSLQDLYSEYEKNFPGSGSEIKRALLLKDYMLAPEDEVYKLLDTSFKTNRKAFTDHKALQTYFMLYLSDFEKGDKGTNQTQFIEKYSQVAAQVGVAQNELQDKKNILQEKKDNGMLTKSEDQALNNIMLELDALDAVSDNISILASKNFTCGGLETFYADNFEKYKNDAAQLEAMVNVFYKNRCYNSIAMYKGAQAVHTMRPTAATAYRLGDISLKRHDVKQSIAYFNEAAELEKSPERKADLYLDIAAIVRNSDKAAAKEYLLKAAQMNPNLGKPYIVLAQMYASVANECNITNFERKALNWLAIETVKKAETAEAKYKPTVAAMIENYNKAVPNAGEVKAAGKRKKDTIAYGCWINETVTIPNL